MINVKDVWDDSEFDAMGWHDCRIYSIRLPDEQFRLSLDIDYIFKWQDSPSGQHGFWVSPCDLIFHNVSGLKIETDYENSMLLFISDIRRCSPVMSPNKKMEIWAYEIECDKGIISFSATGFEQLVRKQPILSETQDLNENR